MQSTEYYTKNGERLWRYRFDGDPADGKRVQVSKAGFPTRGDAVTSLRSAIESYANAKNTAPPASETLADWLRVYLRDYAPERCQPKTLERYHGLASYILDATEGEPATLAATQLGKVDHKIIEAALRALLRMKARRVEHLSPKTVKEIAAVLSVSLNEAFRLEKIAVNPLLRVRLPKAERTEARSLSPEEVQKLRDVCRGDWTFTFVELALATGARRGELLVFTWSDIDWLNVIVTISKSLEETEQHGLRVKAPKSGRSRKFRIGATAVAALTFQRDQQREYRRLYGDTYQDNDLVFCRPDGSYFNPHTVSQTVNRRLAKVGVKNASLHTLRHTHASGLLSNGVPLPTVAARLGHADTHITASIYSHVLPADDARAADAWEKLVHGPLQ